MSKAEEIRPCQGLKTLESNNRHADDNVDVVGKSKKSLLDYFYPSDNESKRKMSKSTQVSITWITEEDISSDTPSEHFWQTLAEKRRLALEDALGENETLCKLYESLTIENNHYQSLLEEANSFVEVFKELVQSNADDTGIDVGDISTSTEADDLNKTD